MSEDFGGSLDRQVRAHSGWEQLECCGRALGEQPLDPEQLRLFLGSTAEFFREIPGGILSLALRVTDDWMSRDRFGAVRRGAKILHAAADEFGLAPGEGGVAHTHHELFADMAARFGLRADEILQPCYLIPSAMELAACTRDFYRNQPVATAVGFHYASEISSDREFQLCLEGFAHWAETYRGYADHGAANIDELLAFYSVHTEVEPLHGSMGAEVVAMYADHPASREQMLAGANAFMDGYGKFWLQLQRELFAGSDAVAARVNSQSR